MNYPFNVGDKVYIKYNGVVLALKCIERISSFYNGCDFPKTKISKFNWISPTGEYFEDYRIRKIFEDYREPYFYNTIEDCIHGVNYIRMVDKYDFTLEDAAKICDELYPDNFVTKHGRSAVNQNNHYESYIRYYKWDGYCVKAYKGEIKHLTFIENENGKSITGGFFQNCKDYFLTREEAQKGYETKVVDF